MIKKKHTKLRIAVVINLFTIFDQESRRILQLVKRFHFDFLMNVVGWCYKELLVFSIIEQIPLR